jgi:hypothetical protein
MVAGSHTGEEALITNPAVGCDLEMKDIRRHPVKRMIRVNSFIQCFPEKSTKKKKREEMSFCFLTLLELLLYHI